jgi:hypothetical protein
MNPNSACNGKAAKLCRDEKEDDDDGNQEELKRM